MSLVTRENMAAHRANGNVNHSAGPLNASGDHNNNTITPRNGPFADDDLSREYSAPPTSFSIPKQNGSLHDRGGGGMADFFSPEVFQIVLHNPATAHRLHKFSQARMCGENMEFLEKVCCAHLPPRLRQLDSSAQLDRYNALLDELATIMTDIHFSFTATEAPKQIGIPTTLLRKINADIKAGTTSTLPAMENIFSSAQENVEQILRSAVYPRFVKYQITNSASKALATDRQRYQGLGDCFCLTDPAKADNPIVYASDGFVGVTGYSRTEIVPRNCRFLQGNYTDKSATRRLKASIEAKEETVELLLNYKKNGDPFWNLLYVGPCTALVSLQSPRWMLTFICSTAIRRQRQIKLLHRRSDQLLDHHPQRHRRPTYPVHVRRAGGRQGSRPVHEIDEAVQAIFLRSWPSQRSPPQTACEQQESRSARSRHGARPPEANREDEFPPSDGSVLHRVLKISHHILRLIRHTLLLPRHRRRARHHEPQQQRVRWE